MVWACAEKTEWIHWTTDAEYGPATQEEKRKTTEEVHGGHAKGWRYGEGCSPLKAAAQIKRRRTAI